MKFQLNMKTRIIVSLLVVGGTSAAYQNCSKVAFTEAAPAGLSADGTPVPPDLTPSNPSAPGTTVTIRQFQPALAVRDISCLACHANIKANVVSDFGYGNSWFMDQSGDQNSYGNNHYLPNSWQSIAQVQGQIIVPVGNVPNASVTTALASGAPTPQLPMSIANYLNLSTIKDWDSSWTYSYWGRPAPTNLALTTYVTPPAGASTVQEQNFVYIGAPTSKEILSLVANTQAAPWVQEVGSLSTGVTGLSVTAGANGSYITNHGTVECSGKDVVINGTLLLNNLSLKAEKNGCRLYVTGSVFIEGPITYVNSGAAVDPTNNLQISSSASIILGVGINGTVMNGAGQTQSTTPLHERLMGDIRNNLVLRSAQTSSTYGSFAQSILNEGNVIGANLLIDASTLTAGLPTAKSAAGQTRVKVDYQHLLLNAPLIHSRYLGTTTGVIVAESAEFSLGEFSFSYDPVFQTVPVLPALPQDILCAVNAATSCNPAQP